MTSVMPFTDLAGLWSQHHHAVVAQWLERPPVERVAEGSIPFVGAHHPMEGKDHDR